MILRHIPTGHIFEGTYRHIRPGDALTPEGWTNYYQTVDGRRYPLHECEGVDSLGAEWQTCHNCGYRWLSGMHNGHDCIGRLRADRDKYLAFISKLGVAASAFDAALSTYCDCDERDVLRALLGTLP